MCLCLYLASDRDLPLHPWDERHPRFCVDEMAPEFDVVRRYFTVEHVRCVGAHEGCACGFQLGEYPDYEDDDADAKRESLRRLADYLKARLAEGAHLELFACWADEEGKGPRHQRVIRPKDLRGDRFFFLDGELSRVEADT